MSHEIDHSNGRANVAFTGSTPWHGLGVQMNDNQDLNAWRTAAGLDFIVKKAPIQFNVTGEDESVSDHPFPGMIATYREDTMAGLGVVGKHYKVVQPGEIIDFFKQFAAAGDMKLDVAGSLKGGRRVWALARHDMEIKVAGEDVVRPYFLLATSYDGNTSTTGTFSNTRVVCNNTMQMAYQEIKADGTKGYAQTGFSIPHIQHFDAEAAKAHISTLVKASEQFAEKANKMAVTGLSDDMAQRLFAGLVGVPNKDGKDLTKGSREKAEQLFWLYKNGPGADLKSAENTVWGMFNAVTRYVDHMANERRAGGRLESAWFGNGKELKARAFREAERVSSGDFASLLDRPLRAA